jgi:hypothetical protein
MATAFAVGTGRCGTHTLSALFASRANTISLHEGRTYGEGAYHASTSSSLSGIRLTLADLRKIDVGQLMSLNVYLYHAAADRTAAMEDTFRLQGESLRVMDDSFDSRRWMLACCTDRGYSFFEANRVFYNYVTYIHRCYPDAKIIHIVRDPYATVASWVLRAAGAYPMGAPLFDAFTFDVAVCNQRNERNWYVEKPVPVEGEWAERWPKASRAQKLAWFWLHVNDNIARRLAPLPSDQKKILRLEDLTPENACNLLEFSGFAGDLGGHVIRAEDASRAGRERPSQEVISACNEVIGSTGMDRFGYSALK